LSWFWCIPGSRSTFSSDDSRDLLLRLPVAADHPGFGSFHRYGARHAGLRNLQRYGSSEALGVLVALSLTRELGPVVAALLFASRAGSSITAEIGLMKATEQLTAMDMMAVNPIARVVAPRFWGGVISMPLLAALFSAIGVFGGYLIGVVFIGVDEGRFLVPDAGIGRFPFRCLERCHQEFCLWGRCFVDRRF
jgi:hypothetical protein